MRVLSVDLGWRHLAAVQMDVTASDFTIYQWKIIDLMSGDVNINKASLEDLVNNSAPSIQTTILDWCKWPNSDLKPEIAYLELQPLGQMARNVKTKTLSHIFQTLLLAHGIPVQFVSPKKKLAGADLNSYAGNKKFAVDSTEKILEGEWQEWFRSCKGKRDDLADAFLQGYYTAKQSFVQKPKRESKAKQPRAKRACFTKAQESACLDIDSVESEEDVEIAE